MDYVIVLIMQDNVNLIVVIDGINVHIQMSLALFIHSLVVKNYNVNIVV